VLWNFFVSHIFLQYPIQSSKKKTIERLTSQFQTILFEPKLWVVCFAARFSPDDKFSKHRIICKKRFGMLPTQAPPHTY
jgi:hypothetical protein